MSENSGFILNFDDESISFSVASSSNDINLINSNRIIDEPSFTSFDEQGILLSEENISVSNYISNSSNIVYDSELNSSIEGDENNSIFQSSESLNPEIVNGDFSKSDPTADDFGWNTTGEAYVESGRGVLAEGSTFFSSLDQTFTISEDAKSLQFTLVEGDLGDNSFAPPDALEIALLDADTFTPLTETHSLGDTDAFFNLQNDGTVYFSDRVRMGGTTSGDTINLDNSHTVSVDISHLAAGTSATLYFDLLGFGAVDSQVLIDDVFLSDSSLATPIATDDIATINQGEISTIDVLANDSDSDGTIVPASLQIQTQPDKGTAILLPDGRVSYLPNSGFAGEDSFTYVVQDNDGQFSNPATVNVTVNNVAPSIENIQLPDIIIEGTEIRIEAIASDPGNDELTYTWSIGEQTTETQQPTIDSTFIDNGTRSATLTVSDRYGGRDSETFDITVDNAAPTVDAGENLTIDEGETITLSGTYSDLGVNDTHTVEWEFDDGTIIEASTVERTYSEPGTYTATFTATDNDGARDSQTITITVNNSAPTITSLTGDTNISEGETARFNASATDPSNGELTYIWDFGDDSEQLLVNRNSLPVSHTYADNGNYTVTLTVEDEAGALSISTLNITVENVAPAIASIDGATVANEGQTVTYRASVRDSGDDELTYEWSVNGESITNEGDPATINYTFADNGTYSLSLTVRDDDDAATTNELEVIVNNLPPSIEIAPTIAGNEGEVITFDPTLSDPGDDILTVTIDFGDGSEAETISSSEFPVTHIYADNGSYTATLTVSDEDGGITNQTIDVTINNSAPTIIDLTGDTEVNEGETATFNAIASDSGNDTLTYTWDFGDGSSELTVNSDELPVTHTFADNGDYTVTLVVRDSEGASSSSTLDITVNNLGPTITEIVGETNINEGTEVTYSAFATDPGDDTLTYSWNFGDGNTASGKDVTHTFADNGNYTITLTVADDDNASTTQTLDVSVNNVPPAIDEIIGDTEVSEGIEVSYSASVTDPGDDTLTYSWDFGDGTTVEGKDVTHTFADNGDYTITLTVTDEDGASTTSSLDVTVNNLAPTISEIIGETEISEGTEVTYSATATDPGNDTLTYNWNFGDGSEPIEGESVSHIFTDDGEYTITLIVTDSDGASTTSSLDVTVNNIAPTITEIIGNTNVNEGIEVTYSAIASDPGNDLLIYDWDFGDGKGALGENVTHTFTDNGNYTITLTVTDDDGVSTTQTLDVTVNNLAPTIDEIIGETNINEGQLVTYRAIASDVGDDTLTYNWDFGDSSGFIEGQNVTHAFADNGNYTITLTVTDDDGALTTSTLDVVVNNVAPVIDEIIGETNINEGQEVAYSAIATDPGDDTLTYSWDFGDGSTASGKDVTHTFEDNRSYTITLTVTDDDNASITETLDVIVNNVAPTITEIVGQTEVDEGDEVNYSAFASDPGDDTLTYNWDFGDSNTAVGKDVTHTFADNGNYTITLTVRDDDGALTTSTLDVVVNNVAPIITEIIGETEVNEGQEVTYNAIATDPGIDTLTYSWNFGDGSDSVEGQNVSHTFADNGNYTITLTVTDDDDASTAQTLDVIVNNVAPTITEIIGDTDVNEGEEISYSAIASDTGNDTLTYSWDFGDGSTASGKDVTHTFVDNGSYTVTLIVTDDDGAFTSLVKEVTVNNVAPIITEIIGDTNINEGQFVTYRAIASDSGNDTLTYSWDFGDGSESVEGESATHTFTDNGNYTITLTVTDDDGASNTSTLSVTVNNASPIIDEIIGETDIDEGEEVAYSAIASDPGDDTLTYDWDFGDGKSASGKDITHTFADNGSYTITLTVTDSDGATTSSFLDVAVNNVAPVINEIVGKTEVKEGEEITYSAIASDTGSDTLTYSWDFGDGSDSIEGESVTHVFADNGNYSITLTVTDDDGAVTTSNLDVTVNNVAPTITEIVGNTEVSEGIEATYRAIASDVGDDNLTYSWDFGDGNTALGKDVIHTFMDNGSYTITLAVTDDDGATVTETKEVTVNNVAPVIAEIIGETEVSEGIEVTYSASATDPGNDTLTYNWNFGDGSDPVQGKNVTHIFTDNGEYTVALTVTDDDGASTISTLNVTVENVAPTVTEIIGEKDVNEGIEVNYTAIASDPGNDTLSYSWDFGDGKGALGKDVTHTFADNGNYTITLTVTDDDGATGTSTKDITVNNISPTIEEIIGETDVNEGIEINYSASAIDPGDDTLTYAWNFGDGKGALGKDVTHTFTDNGNYTITLTVTDDDGASTTSTLDVTVNNVAPIITEIIGETDIDEGQEVIYTAIASDSGNDTLTYNWNFGDGTTEEGKDVTHIFTDNGNYTITLTVTDEDGASTTSSLDVTVNNVAPVIENIIGETDINEGQEVTYSAIASDSGSDTLSYSWDFGDGSDSIEGQNVTHTFTDNGNYTITLTVTDDDNASTTSTLDVTVNNVAPVITSFTGDSEIDEGDTASFGVVASDSGEDTLTYAWDFGDGSETVFGENIEHLFVDNGLYDVSVTVTDDDGASITQSLSITVNNVTPVIDPWQDQTSNEGEIISFNASFSDPGILDSHKVEWDFGDGSETVTETIAPSELTDYNLEQTHTYTDDGIYTVTLTITDNDGGVATNTMTVTVNNTAPVITSLTGDTDVNEGQVANFSAIASDAGEDTLTYNWDFGDGRGATGTNVAHTFSDNGNYTVILTVTDDDGGETTSTLNVTVNNVAPLIVSLNGDTEVSEGSVANFSAIASDLGNDTLTYSWDFGDGEKNEEGANVNHVFTDNGNYTVTLTVTDDDGASTSSALDVIVNNVAPSIADISYGEIAEGISTQFTATATDPGNDTLTYIWDFGDGSEPVTGKTVNHLFVDNGNYTITLTVTDSDGGETISQTSVTAKEVFNIKAEGTVRINGSSDLDGDPLSFDDDTRIYAGDGFILNGNQTLPVLRDNRGNPVKVNGKSVLVDRAVTVGPNYTESKANASRRRYTNLIPPQVIDELSVNVPEHNNLVSSQLTTLIAPGTTEVNFNPQQNSLNNVNDWNNRFPASGTKDAPTVVRITNGNLNIPSNVTMSNYVVILENGNVNFNGGGHTLENVAFVLENGSINLASVRSTNLSIFASNSINMNNQARFAGDTLIAAGNTNGSINFNGATVNSEPSYLTIVSQGNIIFNGSSSTIGEFIARGDFTLNGSSTIVGSIQTKGDIRFNGSANISSFG